MYEWYVSSLRMLLPFEREEANYMKVMDEATLNFEKS